MYLRMLVSIPGNKLRAILKYGDERIEDPQFSQVSSLLQATPPSPGYKQPLQVTSYIHFTRATALLVGQSWSLVLHDLYQDEGRTVNNGAHGELPLPGKEPGVVAEDGADRSVAAADDVTHTAEDDAGFSEFQMLHEYFSLIPDYINGSGIKVTVQCYLKFKADAQPSHAEGESPRSTMSGPSFSKAWPALYAVVLSFSTSGPYGHVPSVHIPFLMSEPLDASKISSVEDPSSQELQIVECNEGPDVSTRLDSGEGIETKTQAQEQADKGEPEKDSVPNLEDEKKPEIENGHGSTDGSSIPEQLDEDAFKEAVVLELEPKQPVPTIIDAHIVTGDEEGRRIEGQLDSIHVGIEDLFAKAPLPLRASSLDSSVYYYKLFNVLWEACGKSGKLHTKSFALSGGKEFVSIAGTESVKLLESRADKVVDVVEHFLSPYVVSAKGGQLVSLLKDSGTLQDIVWQEDSEPGNRRKGHLAITYGLPSGDGANPLYDYHDQNDGNPPLPDAVRDNIGSLCILIFLPPRFHILLKMEIADWSTLTHIRTDYWPCLAYVDEFLEALVTSR
ncbi:hypothetical protein L7F22_011311 [Adiantum nelumboides]|nr:hypothetical protein [Adiantum nelumboides]